MNRALKWAGGLFLGFIIVTQQVIVNGPLIHLDAQIANADRPKLSKLLVFTLKKIDNLGLRGLTATILFLAAAYIAYRFKSMRPLNLAILSVLALNLVVGIAKITIGRTKPALNVDLLYANGLSYPSGHASNALLTWGILAYLIYRYTKREHMNGAPLVIAVATLTSAVCVVSLFRNTHWLSDLLCGLFIGGALLVLVIAVDRFFPSDSQHS